MKPNREGDLGVEAVVRRIDEIAGRQSLWPGFDPRRIPLALYDGERTFLFNHPAPPEGFRSVGVGEATAHAWDGRHESIVANTCVELDGVVTATLMLQPLRSLSLDDVAAIAIHEGFHVYQEQRRGVWGFANEADRFRYPITDVDVMAQRLLEIRALRRALASESRSERLGWTRRALRARRERFAAMEPAFGEYERRAEMIEGLASYVEAVAAGRSQVHHLDEAKASDVRQACYGVGHALARLLDEVAPGWKEALEQGVYRSLDEALEAAVEAAADGSEPGEVPVREFSREEVDEILRLAQDDVRRRLDDRRRHEATFRTRLGPRLIVEAAPAAPFQIYGFDPSNAHLADGELRVIHTRFLILQAGESRIEMLKEGDAPIEALTEGAGPSPLFHGVTRVEVWLGRGDWHVEDGEGTWLIKGEGLRAELRTRGWARDGDTIVARIEQSPS